MHAPAFVRTSYVTYASWYMQNYVFEGKYGYIFESTTHMNASVSTPKIQSAKL